MHLKFTANILAGARHRAGAGMSEKDNNFDRRGAVDDLCVKGLNVEHPAQAPIICQPSTRSMALCQGGRTNETPFGAKPGCSGSSIQTPTLITGSKLTPFWVWLREGKNPQLQYELACSRLERKIRDSKLKAHIEANLDLVKKMVCARELDDEQAELLGDLINRLGGGHV